MGDGGSDHPLGGRQYACSVCGGTYRIFVDASTGKVLFEHEKAETCPMMLEADAFLGLGISR